MIPPSFVQELLSRIDIVEVVGRHVQLKKAGINHKGLCPFHGEKSPSFTVSPSRQTYHCFGCGVHGNAVGFLMEHSAMGFIDAVKELAQEAGLTVPEDERSPQERERAAELKERQATLSDVLAKAAESYRKQLKGNERAKDYLKGRGLTGEIAQRFGLGYAPEGWRGLASVFPSYDDPLLEEAGLVIVQGEDDAEKKRYDRFRDRIMFPIRSVQGEVIGFGGRVLDKGEPKYLNSPETPVFIKGRELYGLHEARTGMRQRGYALVVEGYMDVVALAQSGFGNAVATLGTACTAEHVHKLFRFTESVVFSFDGDAAGRRAAGRALEASLPHASDTRSIRFLFLPTEHDPDSYVRELGAEAFEQCVTEAVPLSRQLVEAAREGCDLATAEGRAHFLANAKPMWSALPDGALKIQLLGELAQVGGLPITDLSNLWKGSAATAHSAPDAKPSHIKQKSKPFQKRLNQGTANLLDRALWLLICQSDLWASMDSESHDVLASHPAPYDRLFSYVERNVHDHGAISSQAILEDLKRSVDDPAALSVIDRIAAFHDPDPQINLSAELTLLLDRLRLKAIEEELELLFSSGDISPDALERSRELSKDQRRLKAHLTAAPKLSP